MPARSSLFAPVSLLVGSLLCSSLFGQDSFNPFRYPYALQVAVRLTPEQVGSLERQLAEDPNCGETRMQLIRYYSRQPVDSWAARQMLKGNVLMQFIGYFFHQFGDRRTRRKRGEHVLWFIKNAPEAAVLGWPEGDIDPHADADLYREGEAAWSRHLENDPKNLAVLWNASRFHSSGGDRERSIALLERGQSLDKSNPHWAWELGFRHALKSRGPGGKRDAEVAGRALAHYERAYALSDEEGRDSLSPDLATTAFHAGQFEQAREYAESMLGGHRQGWNVGNRIHYGNLTLGRLALLEGAVEEAKSRLIAAGETSGSPQLNSFGPDMTLAQELLERGEFEVVLRYFSLCSEFWELGQEELQAWTARVEKGGMPDFSMNLNF